MHPYHISIGTVYVSYLESKNDTDFVKSGVVTGAGVPRAMCRFGF